MNKNLPILLTLIGIILIASLTYTFTYAQGTSFDSMLLIIFALVISLLTGIRFYFKNKSN